MKECHPPESDIWSVDQIKKYCINFQITDKRHKLTTKMQINMRATHSYLRTGNLDLLPSFLNTKTAPPKYKYVCVCFKLCRQTKSYQAYIFWTTLKTLYKTSFKHLKTYIILTSCPFVITVSYFFVIIW